MAQIIKERVKERVEELKRAGKRQGEHFIVRRGILYILPIPRSKMDEAWRLQDKGMQVEEIAEVIGESVKSLLEWREC